MDTTLDAAAEAAMGMDIVATVTATRSTIAAVGALVQNPGRLTMIDITDLMVEVTLREESRARVATTGMEPAVARRVQRRSLRPLRPQRMSGIDARSLCNSLLLVSELRS